MLFKKKINSALQKELDYKMVNITDYIAKLAAINYPESVKSLWRKEVYNIFHDITTKTNKKDKTKIFNYIWKSYGYYFDVAITNVIDFFKSKNEKTPIKNIIMSEVIDDCNNYFYWLIGKIIEKGSVTFEEVEIKLKANNL